MQLKVPQLSVRQAGLQTISIGQLGIGPISVGSLALNNIGFTFSAAHAVLQNVEVTLTLRITLEWHIYVGLPDDIPDINIGDFLGIQHVVLAPGRDNHDSGAQQPQIRHPEPHRAEFFGERQPARCAVERRRRRGRPCDGDSGAQGWVRDFGPFVRIVGRRRNWRSGRDSRRPSSMSMAIRPEFRPFPSAACNCPRRRSPRSTARSRSPSRSIWRVPRRASTPASFASLFASARL